jgi:hypothetical protein
VVEISPLRLLLFFGTLSSTCTFYQNLVALISIRLYNDSGKLYYLRLLEILDRKGERFIDEDSAVEQPYLLYIQLP